MKSLAAELQQIIEQAKPALESILPEELSHKPFPTKWSKKEIIGHMIDSAQSNIRRFVVSQYEENPVIVYNQDKWVAFNNWQNWDEKELVTLWYLLNRQVCQLLSSLPPGAGKRQCRSESLHTIEWLAEDYLKHLNHHLHQILEWAPVPYP